MKNPLKGYGLKGKCGPNRLTLFVEGTGPALQKLRDYLTVRNESIGWKIKKTKESIGFWEARLTQEQILGIKGEYTTLKLESLRKEIVDLYEDYEQTFYEDTEEGLVIPAGFWYLCDSIEGDIHLNKEVKPCHVDGTRDYQIEAVNEALKYKRATVVLPTGAGKSRVILNLSLSFVRAGKRVFIVVPTEYLVGQIYDTIKPHWESITAVGGKRKHPKLGTDVFVCTAQSAIKYADGYDVLVMDECLPYTQRVWTKDGPLQIGDLYNKWSKGEQLPLVMSFNEKKQTFEYKKITHAWKRSSNKPLVEIKTCRLKTTTTLNHPFLTRNKGWVKAENLAVGDLLIGPCIKGGVQDLDNSCTESWNFSFLEYATYPITDIQVIDNPVRKEGDGFGLFDLEVEDNHNFVAASESNQSVSAWGGVVVHNCQHVAAATWLNLMTSTHSADHCYNLTATPFRADGLDLAIHAFGGPIVYEKTVRWGIENGWILEPTVCLVTINGDDIPSNSLATTAYKKIFKKDVLDIIKQYMLKGIESKRKIIVIFKTLKPANDLRKVCKDCIPFNVASADFKNPMIAFKNGETPVLVGTIGLISEGVDIVDACMLIVVTQHGSAVSTFQSVGRILRKRENKNKPLVIDITVTGYSQFEKAFHKRERVYKNISNDIRYIMVQNDRQD
jgi:superfamily II DNA or RNA helicase